MRKIFAPWRIDFIESKKPKGCFLCKYPKQDNDEENLILKQGKYSFIILNAYPYSNGHAMVAPFSHVGDLDQLNNEEVLEIHEFLKEVKNAIKEVMNPDGFNIGINLGSEAGAGVPDHIHWHIVPRWYGDHNFMPVLADTRVIPEALDSTYKKLKLELEL